MRFSDAVRAGAKLGPQFGGGGMGGICALQAASLAIGRPAHRWVSLWMHWSELMLPVEACPVGCNVSVLIKGCVGIDAAVRRELIWHLNDIHLWTREQIADWYEATFEVTDESLIAQTVESMKESVSQELVEA